MAEKEDEVASGRLPPEIAHPHLKDFFEFLPELNKESDRGAVLISCSFLDEQVRRTLLAYFIDDKEYRELVDGFNAPLGSFGARVRAAGALGLLRRREREECDLLRKVRNRFSHEVHVSFADEGVKMLCGKLTYSVKSHGDTMMSAKGQFVSAATSLILTLANRPAYVAHRRCGEVNWEY